MIAGGLWAFYSLHNKFLKILQKMFEQNFFGKNKYKPTNIQFLDTVKS